jgi:hypothetical protein
MTLGIYGDGGSMRGSGIDSRDIVVSFICYHCEYENEEVDATAEGYIYYTLCQKCGEDITGDIE